MQATVWPWEADEYVVCLGSGPVGGTLRESEAKAVADWLNNGGLTDLHKRYVSDDAERIKNLEAEEARTHKLFDFLFRERILIRRCAGGYQCYRVGEAGILGTGKTYQEAIESVMSAMEKKI